VPCVHITTRYKSQFSDFAQVHQLIHVSWMTPFTSSSNLSD
jgi:hypothetical protein